MLAQVTLLFAVYFVARVYVKRFETMHPEVLSNTSEESGKSEFQEQCE